MRSLNNKNNDDARSRTCIVLVATFALCTLFTTVDAFSSSQLVTRGRNCVRTTTVPSMAVRNQADQSGLFPGDGPYVPMGLSAEEYKRIKSDEAKKQQKMEFGAWGPRFKRTDTPDGDWMVMPSLWTNGNNPNARPGSQVVDEGNDDAGINAFASNLPRRTSSLIRQHGPSFALAFVLLELAASAVTMYRALAEGAVRKTVWSLLKYGLLAKKKFYALTLAQTLAAKFTLSACLTPAMNGLLEKMNRRKLWSQRRTILTTTGTGILALTGWATMLVVLSVR